VTGGGGDSGRPAVVFVSNKNEDRTMKIRIQPFLPAVVFAGAVLAAGSASLHAPPAHADESPPPATTTDDAAADDPATAENPDNGAAGLSGNLYFTDENGNPRNPTAAELITAAEGFEKDMERLMGPQKGKPDVRTLPNGATAATVPASRMVLLIAVQNEDGTLDVRHAAVDEDGNVVVPSANELPEK
jgi:hypothetical protein